MDLVHDTSHFDVVVELGFTWQQQRVVTGAGLDRCVDKSAAAAIDGSLSN